MNWKPGQKFVLNDEFSKAPGATGTVLRLATRKDTTNYEKCLIIRLDDPKEHEKLFLPAGDGAVLHHNYLQAVTTNLDDFEVGDTIRWYERNGGRPELEQHRLSGVIRGRSAASHRHWAVELDKESTSILERSDESPHSCGMMVTNGCGRWVGHCKYQVLLAKEGAVKTVVAEEAPAATQKVPVPPVTAVVSVIAGQGTSSAYKACEGKRGVVVQALRGTHSEFAGVAIEFEEKHHPMLNTCDGAVPSGRGLVLYPEQLHVISVPPTPCETYVETLESRLDKRQPEYRKNSSQQVEAPKDVRRVQITVWREGRVAPEVFADFSKEHGKLDIVRETWPSGLVGREASDPDVEVRIEFNATGHSDLTTRIEETLGEGVERTTT